MNYVSVNLGRGEPDGDKELSFVLDEYDIKAEKIIAHKNIYQVFTPNSRFALKKIDMEVGKLLFFLGAMNYLWQKGFYQMSRLVESRTGKLYVSFGPHLYFLTEWVEGKYPDFSQAAHLDAAVYLLADLHKKGEGFEPPQGSIPRNDLGRWPAKWQERICDLKMMQEFARFKSNDFDRVFGKIAGVALDDAFQALDILDSAGYPAFARRQSEIKPLCHRDFVYHNLVYRDGMAYLIDFEYCLQDSRLIDLARFIRMTFINHPWELETAGRIISGYQYYYPLNRTEEKLLSAVLTFPHDIWRIGHKWYLAGQRKDSLYQLLCRQCQFYHQKNLLCHKLQQGFLSL